MASIVYIIFIMSFSPQGVVHITFSNHTYSDRASCSINKAIIESTLHLDSIVISQCKKFMLGSDA